MGEGTLVLCRLSGVWCRLVHCGTAKRCHLAYLVYKVAGFCIVRPLPRFHLQLRHDPSSRGSHGTGRTRLEYGSIVWG